MNLLDVFVKIGVIDEVSDKTQSIYDKITGVLGSAGRKAAELTGTAVRATVQGAAELGMAAANSYADYEQLAGGVSKLFGTAGRSLEQYAQDTGQTTDAAREEWLGLMTAQKTVMDNASEAYRTAGMSANEYMETATTFSASLISSLGGDTQEAARLTDVAMRAISDNVNTFGSDAESVRSAIVGLSRENYTMLDNLKLGYAGTAEGMLQLINDSGVLGETLTDTSELGSVGFAKMIEAIQAVQEQQGIAGTTANEAATTVSGAITMMQASWQNLTADIGAGSDRMGESIEAFVGSIGAVLDNVIPLVERIATSIAEALPTITPMLLEQVQRVIEALAVMIPELLPPLLDAVVQTIQMIAEMLPTITPLLTDAVVQIIMAIVEMLPSLIPALLSAALQLFGALVMALPQIAGELLSGIGEIIGSVLGEIFGSIGQMFEAGAEFLGGLFQGIMQIGEQVVSFFIEFPMKLIEKIASAVSRMLDAGIKFVTGLFDGIKQVAQNVISFFSDLPGNFLSALGDVGGILFNAGASILQGLWDGLMSVWGGIADFVGGIAGWFVNMKGPPEYDAKLLINNGQLIMGSLAKGLEDGFGDVEDVINDVNGELSSGFTTSVGVKGSLASTRQSSGIVIKDCTFNVREDEDIERIGNAISRRVRQINAGRYGLVGA